MFYQNIQESQTSIFERTARSPYLITRGLFAEESQQGNISQPTYLPHKASAHSEPYSEFLISRLGHIDLYILFVWSIRPRAALQCSRLISRQQALPRAPLNRIQTTIAINQSTVPFLEPEEYTGNPHIDVSNDTWHEIKPELWPPTARFMPKEDPNDDDPYSRSPCTNRLQFTHRLKTIDLKRPNAEKLSDFQYALYNAFLLGRLKLINKQLWALRAQRVDYREDGFEHDDDGNALDMDLTPPFYREMSDLSAIPQTPLVHLCSLPALENWWEYYHAIVLRPQIGVRRWSSEYAKIPEEQ
ncbi:hypothetical protein G7Y89_g688 [Cudoniella acicularis]|uniref:Uncharacterized protein n=1 Tax=Cudoniella acicularis TaxID=354080 RepID=A0A8H4W8M7_9HELO|nr:hypothetical protein G7Y89_g688 [Cudoniella acicularis]